MKKNSIGFLIIVLIVFSCKKEKNEANEYPNVDDFVAEMKRGWYVAHYDPYGYASHETYAFDGDSTITIGYSGDYCHIDDSILCTLEGIENIQYWNIMGSNNNLQLESQNLCGGNNHYAFQYTNYRAIEQLAQGYYVMTARIQLIGLSDTITLFHWDLHINPNPNYTKMYFHLDDWDQYFILHPLN